MPAGQRLGLPAFTASDGLEDFPMGCDGLFVRVRTDRLPLTLHLRDPEFDLVLEHVPAGEQATIAARPDDQPMKLGVARREFRKRPGR